MFCVEQDNFVGCEALRHLLQPITSCSEVIYRPKKTYDWRSAELYCYHAVSVCLPHFTQKELVGSSPNFTLVELDNTIWLIWWQYWLYCKICDDYYSRTEREIDMGFRFHLKVKFRLESPIVYTILKMVTDIIGKTCFPPKL